MVRVVRSVIFIRFVRVVRLVRLVTYVSLNRLVRLVRFGSILNLVQLAVIIVWYSKDLIRKDNEKSTLFDGVSCGIPFQLGNFNAASIFLLSPLPNSCPGLCRLKLDSF